MAGVVQDLQVMDAEMNEAINTHDQLVKAGGGIALLRSTGGIRQTYIDGWLAYRLGVDGKEIPTQTEKTNRWYHYGRLWFSSTQETGTFHERQAKALGKAQTWAEHNGERGPWKRNRLGDFVPERINKQFPLRKKT